VTTDPARSVRTATEQLEINRALLAHEHARLEAAGLTPITAELVSDGVDAVRATALREAVTLASEVASKGQPVDRLLGQQALDVALVFEAYLRGDQTGE
jgi:hypothetical protein